MDEEVKRFFESINYHNDNDFNDAKISLFRNTSA